MPNPASLYIEVSPELKRALEDLVLHYKRNGQPTDPRSLSGVVRRACVDLLRRDLPGYTPDTATSPRP